MSERYEDPMHRLTLEMMERLVNAAEEIGIQLSRMNDISEPPKMQPVPADLLNKSAMTRVWGAIGAARKTVPIQGTP
jgi:hypothetical protein